VNKGQNKKLKQAPNALRFSRLRASKTRHTYQSLCWQSAVDKQKGSKSAGMGLVRLDSHHYQNLALIHGHCHDFIHGSKVLVTTAT